MKKYFKFILKAIEPGWRKDISEFIVMVIAWMLIGFFAITDPKIDINLWLYFLIGIAVYLVLRIVEQILRNLLKAKNKRVEKHYSITFAIAVIIMIIIFD
jgi:bacteriorhodopsin